MPDVPEPAEFGLLLRLYRAEARLTQEALAERAGVSTRGIQSLERGEAKPHHDTFERLARALALTAEQRALFLAAAKPVPRQRKPADRPPASPPEGSAPSAGPLPTNLPAQVTSFVGRDREVAEVARLLTGAVADGRLITLTGAGGCGKTRLALQVAADLTAEPGTSADGPAHRHFRHGVWLVELAPLTDPALVPRAVAAAVGVHEETGRPLEVTLAEALRFRHLLLILDNCEHLIEACARLADVLLRTCPHLRLLAVSRQVLGIAGEVSWRVPSLTVPPLDEPRAALVDPTRLMGYEAVRLFVERAVAANRTFELTEKTGPAVARLCQRLDGMPLALELAAARVRVLAVEEIERRLDDRFHLLTGGSRSALPRQQTLAAALAWSYDLLSPAEQELFRRLAVFVGGFTLAAAEAVCADADGATGPMGDAPVGGAEGTRPQPGGYPLGAAPAGAASGRVGLTGVPVHRFAAPDVLDLLSRLVDKSLVLMVEEMSSDQTWYRLLETTRQYAWERLIEAGEAEGTQDRHRDWCVQLAERAEPEVWGAGGNQVAWLGRLEAEHGNLRAALDWCRERDPDAGLDLAGRLWQFWRIRGHVAEGRRRLETLLARSAGLGTAAAKAMLGAAFLARDSGDLGAGQAWSERGLATSRQAGDHWGIGMALLSLALQHTFRGEREPGRAYLRESLEHFRATGHRWGISAAHYHLANIARIEGHYDEAQACLEEALACSRAIGDRRGVSNVLDALAGLAFSQGDYRAAHRLTDESRAIGIEVGLKESSFDVLAALVARAEGDHARAKAISRENLRLLRDAGLHQHIPRPLIACGILAADEGALADGARLIGAGIGLRHQLGRSDVLVEQALIESSLADCRVAMGDEAFAQAWAEGQAMTLERAMAYALAEDTAPGVAARPERRRPRDGAHPIVRTSVGARLP